MSPDEENLAKVVKFDEGPISAIGLKLQEMPPEMSMRLRMLTRPGDIIIYARSAALTPALISKIVGPGFQPSPYGICSSNGCSGAEQSWNIPLEYDILPERQLRKIVARLEQDGLITPAQREKAYSELGLGEELYNRPTFWPVVIVNQVNSLSLPVDPCNAHCRLPSP